MLKCYKTNLRRKVTEEITQIEPDCWIDLVTPNEKEIDRDNLQIEITRLENELKSFEKLNKIIEDKNYILSEKENFEIKLSTENVKLEEFEKSKVQIEEFLEKNVFGRKWLKKTSLSN